MPPPSPAKSMDGLASTTNITSRFDVSRNRRTCSRSVRASTRARELATHAHEIAAKAGLRDNEGRALLTLGDHHDRSVVPRAAQRMDEVVEAAMLRFLLGAEVGYVLGAKAGHDLTIEVTRWHGRATVDPATPADAHAHQVRGARRASQTRPTPKPNASASVRPSRFRSIRSPVEFASNGRGI